jgi:creatinine amidohydrolase
MPPPMMTHDPIPTPPGLPVGFVSRFWSDHTSPAIAGMDRDRLIAVLPVAATEQHGPHLPISTDQAILEGVVAATLPKLPADLPALFLPTAAFGKSNEHARYPGTVTLSATTLIALWMDIGASVARSGVKKLVLFNSHGGQMSVMDIVTRDLREKHGLMVVASNWYTLGLPDGMFDSREVEHGIHAGDIEASVMLALVPQFVKTHEARNFRSLTETLAEENRFLSITPRGKLGWQTQDLNPWGAAGDASKASAERGRAVLDLVSSRFVDLLREVDRYDLRRLANDPAW